MLPNKINANKSSFLNKFTWLITHQFCRQCWPGAALIYAFEFFAPSLFSLFFFLSRFNHFSNFIFLWFSFYNNDSNTAQIIIYSLYLSLAASTQPSKREKNFPFSEKFLGDFNLEKFGGTAFFSSQEAIIYGPETNWTVVNSVKILLIKI